MMSPFSKSNDMSKYRTQSIKDLFFKDTSQYIQKIGYSCDATLILEKLVDFIDSEFVLFEKEKQVFDKKEAEQAANDCSLLGKTSSEREQYKEVFLFLWKRWNETAFAIY